MRIKYFLFVFLLGLSSCWIKAQAPVEKSAAVDVPTTEVRVIVAKNGWGYDIYVNGKKYIHQTTIPSIPGTWGFYSQKEAKKVGDFTADKIKRNSMPPSVTPEELDSLGITLPEK